MLGELIENREKLHTRNIQLTTYHYTDSRVIIHGVLKDNLCTKTFDITGVEKKPGTLHHIDVKLLINTNPLIIEDAEADMIYVPLSECHSTIDTIEKLKGLEVKSGFSKKIRAIMGGKRGCSHLCNLIIVMAQEVVQGSLVQKRKEKSPVPDNIDSLADKEFLINSCRMWTEDGPKIKELKQAIAKHNRP